mgnify:CR=1 FL=1
MTGRHDNLTRSLVGKSRGSTMGSSNGSLTKLSPASPGRRGLGSSGGSDYAADDYLRNKDEHGLTRDDLDDLIKNVLSMSGIERSVTHLVLNSVKEMPPSVPE